MLDFSNFTYLDKSFSLSGNPQAIFFSSDGTVMYISETIGDVIEEYNLSTAWDVSTATASGATLDHSVQTDMAESMFFKPDGTKLYLCCNESYVTVYQYSL